jgi:hypothetical protein
MMTISESNLQEYVAEIGKLELVHVFVVVGIHGIESRYHDGS